MIRLRYSHRRLSINLALALIATLFFTSPIFSTLNAHAATARQSLSNSPSATTNLTNLVDPFTGTGVQPGAPYGGGDTYPGANAPFGMMQWSPDTALYAPGGYWYSDNRIKGFSLTHLNGAGCTTYSDIPFMPYAGAVTTSPATNPAQYISTFSHKNESAHAGYYKVKFDNNVTTELTAAQHSGTGRFTYPKGQTASMLVNVSGSAAGTDDAQVNVGSNTISGWAASGHFCGANAEYRVYFWAQFSQPFASIGTWHNGSVTPGKATTKGGASTIPAVRDVLTAQAKLKASSSAKTNAALQSSAKQHPDTSVSGPGSGAYVTFNTAKSQAVSVKVGLSFVSIDNAQTNVTKENASGNFDTARTQAEKSWNNWLGQIAIKGGTTTQLTTFYTALYHVLLQPNVFSDLNGQYIGFDGRIHTAAKGHAQYANYSGWDIYRSEIQLLALLAPAESSDIIQSMVNDYTQGGTLPKWSSANSETYVMVGDPADPIIASAYAFGARDFDTKAALAAMVKQATVTNPARPGLNYLDSLGYIPTNGTFGCCNFYGPAATSLEYNTADFSISALAKALGDTKTAKKFITRAQNWEKLFNPATGYLEPRRQDGSFPINFDPASQSGWVEGNGAQYNWMVPFNLRGLFNVFGGNAKVEQRLDTFFTKLNAGPDQPYAFLGNEPTLETPWEYDYVGAPYKTQDIVRKVVNTLYTPGPTGLPGNDDLGETSSLYVFSALGFFPETPGTADVALASPLFPSITLHRKSGQTIQINAPQAAANAPFIQSLKVNGKTSTKPWLPASFMTGGGKLDFTLSTTPNTTWGSNPADEPPSYQEGEIPTLVSLNPGRVVVVPGGSAQSSIVGQDITGTTNSITWSVNKVPDGIHITPTSGTVTIPNEKTGNQAFTVAVDKGVAEGYYSATISVRTANGTQLSDIGLQIVVAQPGSLLGLFNNVGISDDSNAGDADFDGVGYSYSAQQLANNGYKPGGMVTVAGTSFTWPNVAPGTDDNIVAAGQTIPLLSAKAGASKLTFLGSSSDGPSQGTVTITYTDGSTQQAQLGFSDWTLGAGSSQPSFNNVVATSIPYRNNSAGKQSIMTYLFASAPIALNTSKQVASVTLPKSADQGQIHVFAISVS